MKYKVLLLTIMGMIIFSTGVKAQQSFIDNQEFYENLCSTRTSFNINVQTCTEFNNFKEYNGEEVVEMVESISESDLSVEKLAQLIRSNERMIEDRTNSLQRNRVRIARNKARIERLNESITNSLMFLQDTDLENQIIDVVMGANNIDDMVIRIEGFNAISRANQDDLIALEQATRALEDSKRIIEQDLDILRETKVKQEQLLLEFQRREIELYSRGNSGGFANFNSNVNNVDLTKINDEEEKWTLPTRTGWVSATTWFYPFGGWHPGMDIALPIGSPIIAPADGILLATSNGFAGYGNHMVTAHRRGNFVYTILYAHLSSFANITEFSRGETIGFSGNTGMSTGPHVHIEVFRHNTDDLEKVVNEFRRNSDYWFGLGYNSKGDCLTVCRLQPVEVFGLRMGQNF